MSVIDPEQNEAIIGGDVQSMRYDGTGSLEASSARRVESLAPADRLRSDVALLIDWENLKWSLANKYHVTPNISSLVEAARVYGRLVVARAYADWTMPRLVPDAPNLYRAGIEPVYVPGRHPVGNVALKNSADVRLAVDAVELCGRLPHVGTYLLVTGDGDLIHALNFLRLNGRYGVVVGVGDTMNTLLSAAADSVLLYERDIEPQHLPMLGGVETPPVTPGAPPPEVAIEWVCEILAQSTPGTPYPLTDLGQHLKRIHNFDARQWYGRRLKDILMLGQETGRLHLSTIGGFDHVSLPDVAHSVPDALSDAPEDTPNAARRPLWTATAIGLDALSEDDTHTLLLALRDLEQRSSYLVFKYVVDNLTRDSVLPQLARDQIDSLVQDLIDQNMLLRQSSIGANALGDQFTYTRLALNTRNPIVREVLGLSIAEPPTPADDPARVALLDIIETHGMFSGLGRRFMTAADIQTEMESRVALQDIGYVGAMSVIQKAERDGVVRTLRQDDKTILVTTLDHSSPLPAVGDDLLLRPIWYTLGDVGLRSALGLIAGGEDVDSSGKGLTLTTLVVLLQGVMAAEGDTAGRGGRIIRDTSAIGKASTLVTRHLVDAGLVTKTVTTESDEGTGLHRVERFPLNREHPLVVRAIGPSRRDG